MDVLQHSSEINLKYYKQKKEEHITSRTGNPKKLSSGAAATVYTLEWLNLQDCPYLHPPAVK